MSTVFNKYHKNLKFTSEYKKEENINFLDPTISRNKNEGDYKIYREPTQTNTVINAKWNNSYNIGYLLFDSGISPIYLAALSSNKTIDNEMLYWYNINIMLASGKIRLSPVTFLQLTMRVGMRASKYCV